MQTLRSHAIRVVREIPGGRDLLRWIRGRRVRALARAAMTTAAPVAPAFAEDLVLWLLVPDLACDDARAFPSLAPQIRVATASACAPGELDYVYAPDSLAHGLDAHALRNVLLCVAHQALDFVVVSHGMEEPPQLRITTPRCAVVLSAAAKRSVDVGGQLPPGARGRIVRVLPAPAGAVLRDATPSDLGLGPLEAAGAELRVAGAGSGTIVNRRPHGALFPAVAPPRETVLVLPIMLAVGGAERNLIEVAKTLRDRYAFVVVTTERLLASRGSLHHQLLAHCEALFEIGELAPQSEFVALIESIAKSYRPSLLWICNGSPWLLAHAAVLRRVFEGVPIVDQQVYDTDAGWIAHYGDAGIQSFDRFIAINHQIERVFRERIGIAPERIDLVHHAVDTARFHLAAADRCQRDVELQAFDLPRATPLIGMVGRLTAQKRPLDFLELARRARDAGVSAHFVLVGDGELGSACDAFVARTALDTVHRVPFCDDMSRLYPLFSGLVICSEYEGLPISMLEALAMGVPVLSNRVGDVSLVLDEFQVGRLVPNGGDANTLFAAFSAWWGELPQLRAQARVAAPRIAERFSAEASAAAYEASFTRAKRERAERRATPVAAHA